MSGKPWDVATGAKDTQIIVRASERQIQRWKVAADAAGMSLSAWVRDVLMTASSKRGE